MSFLIGIMHCKNDDLSRHFILYTMYEFVDNHPGLHLQIHISQYKIKKNIWENTLSGLLPMNKPRE